MANIRWIVLNALAITIIHAAPRELTTDELITVPRPGEEYVHIQTNSQDKINLKEQSFVTSHRIPEKKATFETSHKVPYVEFRPREFSKQKVHVDSPDQVKVDQIEAESQHLPSYEKSSTESVSVVTRTSVKMTKSKKVQKSMLKAPQDVQLNIKSIEGTIDETANADDDIKEVMAKKHLRNENEESNGEDLKKPLRFNVPFEDDVELPAKSAQLAAGLSDNSTVTTPTTEEPPITTFNYKNVYTSEKVKEAISGKDKYKFEAGSNESIKVAESRTPTNKKDTKQEKKTKLPKKEDEYRQDPGFYVLPVNKVSRAAEDNFDFVDLDEKVLESAGSSPGQGSRINIKKGPNGQEYEYVYYYYYYDDEDEEGKNGTLKTTHEKGSAGSRAGGAAAGTGGTGLKAGETLSSGAGGGSRAETGTGASKTAVGAGATGFRSEGAATNAEGITGFRSEGSTVEAGGTGFRSEGAAAGGAGVTGFRSEGAAAGGAGVTGFRSEGAAAGGAGVTGFRSEGAAAGGAGVTEFRSEGAAAGGAGVTGFRSEGAAAGGAGVTGFRSEGAAAGGAEGTGFRSEGAAAGGPGVTGYRSEGAAVEAGGTGFRSEGAAADAEGITGFRSEGIAAGGAGVSGFRSEGAAAGGAGVTEFRSEGAAAGGAGVTGFRSEGVAAGGAGVTGFRSEGAAGGGEESHGFRSEEASVEEAGGVGFRSEGVAAGAGGGARFRGKGSASGGEAGLKSEGATEVDELGAGGITVRGSGYRAKGSTAGGSGFRSKGAASGTGGYTSEGSAEDESRVGDGAAGAAGHRSKGFTTGKSGYRAKGAAAGSAGNRPEGSVEDDSGAGEAAAGGSGYRSKGFTSGKSGYRSKGAAAGGAGFRSEGSPGDDSGAGEASSGAAGGSGYRSKGTSAGYRSKGTGGGATAAAGSSGDDSRAGGLGGGAGFKTKGAGFRAKGGAGHRAKGAAGVVTQTLTENDHIYNGHDGPALETYEENISGKGSASGRKYHSTESSKSAHKLRKKTQHEVSAEDKADSDANRVGSESTRYSNVNRQAEQANNEILPAGTRPQYRSRGRISNAQVAQQAPAEDIPSIGEERLPSNTRFPPRSRNNSPTSPQPQETTSRTRNRESSNQNRVRLPNLGLLDSSSFRTHSSDASIDEDPIYDAELQRRPTSRERGPATEAPDLRRDEITTLGHRRGRPTTSAPAPVVANDELDVPVTRRPAIRRPIESRVPVQIEADDEVVRSPETNIEQSKEQIATNGRRPESEFRGIQNSGAQISGIQNSEAQGFQGTGFQSSGIQGSALEGSGIQTSGIQGSALQGSGIQGSALQGSGIQGSGIQGSALQGSGIQSSGIQGSALQGSGIQSSGIQGSALEGSGIQSSGIQGSALQGSGIQSSGIQGSALHSSGIQSSGIQQSGGQISGAQSLGEGIVQIAQGPNTALNPVVDNGPGDVRSIEVTTENESTLGLTSTRMEKVALDLYAILQQAQDENIQTNFVDGAATEIATEDEYLSDVTTFPGTTTTTTTTTEATTTSTTTTTSLPTTAAGGRGRYRIRGGGGGGAAGKGRTRTTSTTTELPPEPTTQKARGRFQPGARGGASSRRVTKPKVEAVEEEAPAAAEENSKPTGNKAFGGRNRFRGAVKPTTTTTTTAAPSTGSGAAAVSGIRGGASLDRFGVRRRGGNRVSVSTASPPSDDSNLEAEKQDTHHDAAAQNTAEESASGGATGVAGTAGATGAAGAGVSLLRPGTRPRIQAGGARPLRPGPRVPLNLAHRGRAQPSTASPATEEETVVETEAPAVVHSEEVQEAATPQAADPLSRLKNRPRLRIGAGAQQRAPAQSPAAPSPARKKLVSPLLPKRRPGEEKIIEKQEEVVDEQNEEVNEEEGAHSSIEPSSTTEAETKGLPGLLNGRRRNLIRRPGTLIPRAQQAEAA